MSPDIGGGFGGKVPVYPGYVIAIAASVVLGKPVKWIEDRMENLQADSFARDYHMDAELAADADGRIRALRIKTLADHGYSDAAGVAVQVPGGPVLDLHGLLRHGAGVRRGGRGLHEQAAGGRRVPLLVPGHGGRALPSSGWWTCWLRKWARTRPSCGPRTSSPRTRSPTSSPLGWEYDSGDYQAALEQGQGDRSATTTCAGSRPRSAPGASSWGSASPASPRSWARGPRRTSTSWASRCSTRRE